MTTATGGLRRLFDLQRATLVGTAARARSSGRTVIAGATAELEATDAVGLFGAARAHGLDATAWIRPSEASSLVGVGAALMYAARGLDRLAALRRRWDAVRRSELIGSPPRAFLGLSFDERGPREDGPDWDDFPAALLLMPRLLIERRGSRHIGHAYAVVGPDAEVEAELEALDDLLGTLTRETRLWRDSAEDPLAPDPSLAAASRVADLPSPDRWHDLVTATRADVRAGRVEKAVLARTVRVGGAPDLERALAVLVSRFPHSTVFAVGRGDACLVGATPESLVRLGEGMATVSCVAGTAPRDDDPARDALRARALAESEKEREEHAIVEREARSALAPLCDEVSVSGPVRPVALANVWHLASEVRGRARPDVDLIDLAGALHPTPAVCGHPRREALRILAEREPFQRGWYTGALGWIDARGDGELAVALRCALVTPEEAWLFAGCGIVAGSEPDAELAESEAKLRPMLEALGVA